MASLEEVRAALGLIARKSSRFGEEAAKVSLRKEPNRLIKAANKLTIQALSEDIYTQTERDLLVKSHTAVEDDTFSYMLRVRMSRLQEKVLAAEAEARGLSVSEYARRKIFDEI